MFQFGRFPAYAYFIQRTLRDSSSRWFPNSDICGSGLICSSPQLFAACHVLRRLPMPRHSLCALFSLNFSDNISRYCPRFLVIDSFELVTIFRLAIFVVSFTNLNGKTFISVLFTNPVWFFSIICSFAYSVFNEHLIPRVLSRELVGLDGLEPSTSRLSGARSNHLSYRPFSLMVIRFESFGRSAGSQITFVIRSVSLPYRLCGLAVRESNYCRFSRDHASSRSLDVWRPTVCTAWRCGNRTTS